MTTADVRAWHLNEAAELERALTSVDRRIRRAYEIASMTERATMHRSFADALALPQARESGGEP